MKKAIQVLLVNTVLLFLLFCLVESSLWAIARTRLLACMPRAARMSLYNESRNVIQFLPDCAEYDPELTYVLRKNDEFTFKNIEYRTRYRTNDLGLRDDNDSLRKPEIIALGDSFAMGWGVEQDETFAEILQKKTGLTTLNAGMSSYGTVRELKMLNRIDTGRLRYLLIQYCENDILENYEFYRSNFRREPMSEYWYRDLRTKYGYQFGKYSRTLARFIKNNITKLIHGRQGMHEKVNLNSSYEELGVDSVDAREREVDLFLFVLRSYGNNIDFRKVKVIVFELSEPSRHTGHFIRALGDRFSAAGSDGDENIGVVDMMARLGEHDFFLIDEHINRNGHLKVANVLIEEINSIR